MDKPGQSTIESDRIEINVDNEAIHKEELSFKILLDRFYLTQSLRETEAGVFIQGAQQSIL